MKHLKGLGRSQNYETLVCYADNRVVTFFEKQGFKYISEPKLWKSTLEYFTSAKLMYFNLGN